jgi:hypothetical protein
LTAERRGIELTLSGRAAHTKHVLGAQSKDKLDEAEGRELGTESTLLQIAVVVEEDTEKAGRIGWPTTTEEEVRKAVLAAVAVLLRDRPHARVEWASLKSVKLDGKPWFGRCAVCNRWVFDGESSPELGAGGVSRGAQVEGLFRCDEHLPPGHPLCFAGRGYDGPIPG